MEHRFRDWRPLLAANLCLVLAYLVAAKLGRMLALPPGYASPLSPAAGIALAFLVTGGWRLLPGMLLASALAALLLLSDGAGGEAPALAALLGLGLAPALQGAAGAALFRRWIDPAIAAGRDVLRFLLLAPVMCAISASVSIAALGRLNLLAPAGLGAQWLTWWVGDTTGVLLAAPLCWVMLGRPRELWKRRAALVALPLLLAGGASIAVYRQAMHWEQSQQLQAFRLKAQQVGDLLQAEFSAHERFIEAIAHALGDPGGALSPSHFSSIARGYINAQPQLLSMAWLPRVSAAQRPALEAWASAHERAGYRIVDVGRDGVARPAPARSEYYPTLFVEPDTDLVTRGRDFLSEPARAEALARTMRTGRPAASVPVAMHEGGWRGIHLLQIVENRNAAGPPLGALDVALKVEPYLARAVGQAGVGGFAVGFDDVTPGHAPVRLIGPGAGSNSAGAATCYASARPRPT